MLLYEPPRLCCSNKEREYYDNMRLSQKRGKTRWESSMKAQLSGLNTDALSYLNTTTAYCGLCPQHTYCLYLRYMINESQYDSRTSVAIWITHYIFFGETNVPVKGYRMGGNGRMQFVAARDNIWIKYPIVSENDIVLSRFSFSLSLRCFAIETRCTLSDGKQTSTAHDTTSSHFSNHEEYLL